MQKRRSKRQTGWALVKKPLKGPSNGLRMAGRGRKNNRKPPGSWRLGSMRVSSFGIQQMEWATPRCGLMGIWSIIESRALLLKVGFGVNMDELIRSKSAKGGCRTCQGHKLLEMQWSVWMVTLSVKANHGKFR